jgi:MFS family permease
LRALLYIGVTTPTTMLAVQVLDGATGAILTVLTILVITDLTTGSGRFNLAQGVVGTLTGIAAAVSTALVGMIVSRLGDTTGFFTMAAVTALGMAAIAWLPESKPAQYDD